MTPALKSQAYDSSEPLIERSPLEGGTSGGASVSSAVFNVSTSIVGAGIMSIPAAMKVLGVIPAFFLIAAVALLADVSVEFMLRYTGWSLGPPSYAGIMRDAFGHVGSTVLNLCIALTTAGTLVMYLIIIGDVMSGTTVGEENHGGVLQEWFGPQWWNGREVALLIIAVFVLLPLVLAKRLDSLRFTSAASILLAVLFMCISLGIAIYALFQGKTKTPRLFPDFDHLPSIFDVFTAVPVIVVAFTFHFNVHPIRAELNKNSEMTSAVRISLALCSIIYFTVGFFGYLLFGESTMADILSNFDNTASSTLVPPFVNDIVRLSYALHLVLVFPLLHYSLRLNMDELLFPKRMPLVSDNLRFLFLTGCLMSLLYVAAIAIPNIWIIFQYSGSTSAVCVSLIFPGVLVLRDVHGIATRKDKALAATMIVLAVITSLIALASNIMSSINGTVTTTHGV
ncbi:Transmembrane amino acid transporter family protein [Rhynchospora pubera]|uniref:Transmembrane amino acid transporter family protein n=1 Tax=Rhynchospora pubera TaxID=906938 RepID=A0AAV8FWU3_9POAL|nr:Transmembrane amino acid transporter family protein [Rhynchospora pubera]